MIERHPARILWHLLEPIHAIVYFAPEVPDVFAKRGLKGFWRTYFAARAAPLGHVGAGAVVATFYGFHPDFVHRAVPSIWQAMSPDDAVEARLAGVDRAMVRIEMTDIAGTSNTAEILRAALDQAPVGGRSLFAANRDLPMPEEPHLALWQAATTYREFRGDGHVAALLTHGLDGLESTILRLGVDGSPRDSIAPHRGWTEADWSAACERLLSRGLVDRDSVATAAGVDLHRTVEQLTDTLCAPVVDRLERHIATLLETLVPLANAVSGQIPYPNPMGVPQPTELR